MFIQKISVINTFYFNLPVNISNYNNIYNVIYNKYFYEN